MVPIGIVSKPVETALLEILAVRDPDADPVTNAKGNIEPDPDFRDYENVPLPSTPVSEGEHGEERPAVQKTAFYVRIGNSTHELSTTEKAKYLLNRWPATSHKV